MIPSNSCPAGNDRSIQHLRARQTELVRSFQVRTLARGIAGMLTVTATDGRKVTAFAIDGRILLSSIGDQQIINADPAELARLERDILAKMPKG